MHILGLLFFLFAALTIQDTAAMQTSVPNQQFVVINVLPFSIKISLKNKNNELVLNEQVVKERSIYTKTFEHENWPLFLQAFRENNELLLDMSVGSDVSGAEFYLSTDKDNPIAIAVLKQNQWIRLE